MACPDCDLLNRVPRIGKNMKACCARCGAVLFRARPASVEQGLALVLAGLILFSAANAFPFLGMRQGSALQQTEFITGIQGLFNQGMGGLATLVLLTSVLFPLLELMGLFYVLLPLYFGPPAPYSGLVFRIVRAVQPWSMLEVFLLGVIVSLVKLSDTATILPGISVWAFGALVFVFAGLRVVIEPQEVWRRLGFAGGADS